jgi:MYXO-CTERM domain-containing protein
MSFSQSLRSLSIGVLVASAVALSAPAAEASQQFPGVLLEVADMPCVPTCLVCHTTNPGQAGMFKPLAVNLFVAGAKKQDEESLRKAFAAYAATAATMPGVTDVLAALKRGEDPQSPGTSVCGATYGCGARVAKTPPTDRSAIGFAVAAVAAAALLRRRKPAR